MKTLANMMRKAAMAGVLLAALATLSGCDEYGLGGLGSLGTGGWFGGFPSATLYNPTGDIQSVIANRQAAMGRSAEAWGQYMTGDYYGGDNDDPTTPTAWASGYEWP